MNLKLVRFIDKNIGIPLIYLCQIAMFHRKGATKNKASYKNILLIKFWGIGNVSMVLPAAAALKNRFPEANIDFLTLSDNKELLSASGIFNNIYTISNDKIPVFLSTLIRAFGMLKKRNYDLVVDFEQFARFSALLCMAINADTSIGFNTKSQHRHYFYTAPVPYDNNLHMTRSFLGLVEHAGVKSSIPLITGRTICKETAINSVRTLLEKGQISTKDILVLMHPGTSTNFIERRWPAEYFAKLADNLIGNFNVKIIFTGLSYESPCVRKSISNIKSRDNILDACDVLGFDQYLALISLSDLVISADTSSVHLASYMSVPTVGMYGPNTPVLYGPWGERSIWFYKKLPCSPCITNYNSKINICRHPDGNAACMKKISPDEVFSTIRMKYFDNNAPFRIKKLNE